MAYRGCGYMDSRVGARAVLRFPPILGRYQENLSVAEKPNYPVLCSD